MHILNHFVTAQCFLLLLFYPDAERDQRVIWILDAQWQLRTGLLTVKEFEGE